MAARPTVAETQPTGGQATGGATSTRERAHPVEVSLALDWTPNTNHTGIYVAQERGWYADQGVKLRLLPYVEGSSTDQLVSSGKATFGISFEETVVQARAAGQDVVSIAAIIQHNTSALATLRSSGLDRPRKLDGKLYAGYGAPTEEPIISTMIRSDGGKGTYKTVTANLGVYEALKARRADFAWLYMGVEGVQAKREGVKLNAFYMQDYGVPDFYTPVLVTSRKQIERNPEAVYRFMAATARGYEYAIAHPDEAAKLLVSGAGKAAGLDPNFARDSQRWLSPRYKGAEARWGTQTLKKWTDYPSFMYKAKKVLDASGKPAVKMPDAKSYFTNEFLPR
ncbi:MAG: ABC transporter substrate-binding protein [Chloroflexota bacterium]|nr:ABC transporter substrate-binding protein [Chloroflexota bacterium]